MQWRSCSALSSCRVKMTCGSATALSIATDQTEATEVAIAARKKRRPSALWGMTSKIAGEPRRPRRSAVVPAVVRPGDAGTDRNLSVDLTGYLRQSMGHRVWLQERRLATTASNSSGWCSGMCIHVDTHRIPRDGFAFDRPHASPLQQRSSSPLHQPLRASHQNPHHRAHPVHLRRARNAAHGKPAFCIPVYYIRHILRR